MIIKVNHDEIMSGVSAAYNFDEDPDGDGYVLRISTLSGEIRFHFQRPEDVRGFVNRIVQAVNR